MKIQCNACEAAEARVLCCADEAALCLDCDQKVHAANKLAGKHQRVPLILPVPSSPRVPNCDVCQEAAGYFFCLEDRALLCRKCDVAIHTANPYVSVHQRFLVTGVRVGLDPIVSVAYVAKEPISSAGRTAESSSKSLPSKIPSSSLYGQNNGSLSGQFGKGTGVAANRVSFPVGTIPGAITDWPLEDFFGLMDFNQNYDSREHASSKADSPKFGFTEASPLYRSNDEDLDFNECLGQVPEISWTVPELPSPPTASGLHWQKHLHFPASASENVVSVPDICSSPNAQSYRSTANAARKRSRTS